MPYPVRADAFHYPCVRAPVQRPGPHVMVAGIVDDTVRAVALRLVMHGHAADVDVPVNCCC